MFIFHDKIFIIERGWITSLNDSLHEDESTYYQSVVSNVHLIGKKILIESYHSTSTEIVPQVIIKDVGDHNN